MRHNQTTNHDIDGYLRLRDVLKLVPVSRATWWAGIRDGRFPAGSKLGPKIRVWRKSEIVELLDRIQAGEIK